MIPQGNASHGYWSNVKVFVLRSNGATTELDVPVRVGDLKIFCCILSPFSCSLNI